MARETHADRAEMYPASTSSAVELRAQQNTVLGTRRDYSLVLQATWDISGSLTRTGQTQTAYEYAAVKDNHRQARR